MTDATLEAGPEPAALGLALSGERLPLFDAAPQSPAGYSPLRRPGSARRTMSIDVTWPDGRTGHGVYAGECRDVRTPIEGGSPVVLAEDRIAAVADHRTILALSSDTSNSDLTPIVGVRAGGHLRAALDRAVPQDKAAGTPLYLLLDDLAGATLVSGWAFSRWTDDWLSMRTPEEREAHAAHMEGICIGFRPGSTALFDQSRPTPQQNATRVLTLVNPEDPEGWHPLIDRGGVNFRRARRIDVWREDDLLRIDAAFQDSASAPDGGDRLAIHEYRLIATADIATMTLRSIEATPGTLPYKECPAAPSNIGALIGLPLRALRDQVLITLRKTAGCTHLNDALRALAEVPILAEHLPPIA